jgi:hypothetical protein
MGASSSKPSHHKEEEMDYEHIKVSNINGTGMNDTNNICDISDNDL